MNSQTILTADYADNADVLRKEIPLSSVISAPSAVKLFKEISVYEVDTLENQN
jgi:hypothetical protein